MSSVPIIVLIAAAGLIAGGCATSGPAGDASTSAGEATATNDSPSPAERPSGSRALIATESRGFIPYDNFTLPLVSPGGDAIATQVGTSPGWDAVLAAPGSSVPVTSRIEIYSLPPETGAPAMTGVVSDSVVLGRSCNQRGFLVESPRDGSGRWIGQADWTNGAIDWIVQDDEINAFAALGPSERLAWCRLNGEDFDLVMRSPDGSQWSVPGEGGDWLMPTWSGRDSDLYVLYLRGGFLDMIHGDATSIETFRATAKRVALGAGGDRAAAYQVMSGQIASGEARTDDRLLFYHPSRQAMAVWDPSDPNGLVMLDPGSFNGAIDGDHALVASAGELHRRAIANDGTSRVGVLTGLHIPRPISSGDWRYVLFAPGDGGMQVTTLAVVD